MSILEGFVLVFKPRSQVDVLIIVIVSALPGWRITIGYVRFSSGFTT